MCQAERYSARSHGSDTRERAFSCVARERAFERGGSCCGRLEAPHHTTTKAGERGKNIERKSKSRHLLPTVTSSVADGKRGSA
jgi:hypothetical protein